MTPEQLLALADAATKSGPWVVTLYGADKNGEHAVETIALGSDDFITTDGGFYGPNEKNARLIALAPDLARLCAELGEALQALANPNGIIRAGDPSALRIPPHEFAATALTKLAELEAPK